MICVYHMPNPTGSNMRARWIVGWLLATLMAGNATAAGKLVIERAWIRAAPPGAMMLAGYASLRNAGDSPLTVTGAGSADFGDISLHRSVEENGVERMLPLGHIVIAPGASVEFAPGGRHFMLMQPARALRAGDRVKIHIDTEAEAGDGASMEFTVRDEAPGVH
jgi:copper(I)-binding protein